MNRPLIILMILSVCCTGGVVMANANTGETLRAKGNKQGSHAHITTDDSIRHIVEHPAFKGFSQLLLPIAHDTNHLDTPLSDVRSLMPYHDHVHPDIVVGALNHMIDEVNDGKTIFYDFYTEQQKLEDPTKNLHFAYFLHRFHLFYV